ncbi:MAG: DNA polymerase III subunit gamma/tau [Minisyncoccales bacterium]
MSHLVFYRKYRPQRFSEIVGQEHVVKTITNAIISGRVSHAYLFCGPRGSGKTTIARLLAKSLNCEKRDGAEPCGKCPSCIDVAKGSAIDLIEIDAASHRGIDEVRELKEGIKFAPTGSNKKVYIIDEAHQLTKEAANALLKILEEAPPHAIFILATTEAHKMIPTIISRCQRFDFRKLTLAELVSRLKLISEKEGMNISKEALELIALNSEGAARDAEGLLGQIASFLPSDKMIEVGDIEGLLGLVDVKFASEMTEYILVKDPKRALELIDELINRGKDLREFAKILTDYLRKTMIVKILEDETDKKGTPIMSSVLAGLTDEDFKKMKEQAARFKEEDLKMVLDLMIEAQNKMKYSSIMQLPLELVIIEMTGINR